MSTGSIPPAGGVGGSDNQVQVNDGGVFAGISNGSSGDVLTSNGAGSPPTFQAAGASGITELTGDVTAGPGSGSQAATLANTAVTPGSYTATNLTVDSKGRITAAANGSGGTVTHSAGNLTANQLVVGNGSADLKVVSATDGQIPIGKSSDGTVTLAALTGGTNIAITNGAASATIALDIPLTNDGNSSTALTIDWGSKKNGRHRFTLTGNVTLTLNNPVDGGVYALLISTGAGSFTVTWPASVLWPGGSAPVITTSASKVDLVTLIYDSTATKYYGSFNQNY